MESLRSLACKACFWYLRRFPWRDGKARVYERFHRAMAPAQGWVALSLQRGFTLRLDLADPVQRRLFFFGDYDERREADLISRILERGEVFWDVGANLGYFTLLAAACLQNTGRVAAFEASRRTFACLEANVALNPFGNIVLWQAAVTDREGEAVLYRTPGSADGRANLFRPAGDQTERETVPTLTLDAWRRQKAEALPDIIKLDIEGAEAAALRGAQETLAGGHPLLLVETKDAICRALGTERAALQEFLQPWGYHPAALVRGRWQVVADLRQVKSRNVLWLKPDLLHHRQKASRAGIRGI
ncbi:MAG: FkbM family methyltransferase [Desulfobaccales bacterium]